MLFNWTPITDAKRTLEVKTRDAQSCDRNIRGNCRTPVTGLVQLCSAVDSFAFQQFCLCSRAQTASVAPSSIVQQVVWGPMLVLPEGDKGARASGGSAGACQITGSEQSATGILQTCIMHSREVEVDPVRGVEGG